MSTKTVAIYTRFTEKDAAAIEQIAKKNGVCRSTLVRNFVIEKLIFLGKRKKDEGSNMRDYSK